MSKKTEPNEAALGNPVFAFGLDENGKPIGARFMQGWSDQVAGAALDMGCRVVQNHSATLAELGMKLPVGRVYASGKTFIPNIRRDLFGKLEAARQLPPENVEGVTPIHLFKEKEAADKVPVVACASPMVSGLPKSWDAIAPGHMVLIHESPEDGWWEAVVQSRENEVLTLRYRDYPKAKPFLRHLTAVALVNPGPG